MKITFREFAPKWAALTAKNSYLYKLCDDIFGEMKLLKKELDKHSVFHAKIAFPTPSIIHPSILAKNQRRRDRVAGLIDDVAPADVVDKVKAETPLLSAEEAIRPNPLVQKLNHLGEQLDDARAAIEILQPLLVKERAEASARYCDTLKPQYDAIAQRVCAALIELGAATEDHRAFLSDIHSQGAASSSLRPMRPESDLGSALDPYSPLRLHLGDAIFLGHLDPKKIPAAWSARKSSGLREARSNWHARFEGRRRAADGDAGKLDVLGADSNAAEILLYDEVGRYGVTAKLFAQALDSITAPAITLRINSPGGDVFDGLAIYAALTAKKAKITTSIEGLAASIASIIALAGNSVAMAENSFFMIHKAWTFTIGNADDHITQAGIMQKIDGQLASIYAGKTGRPLARIQGAMAAETWFTADEAKTFGLVDSIIGKNGSSSATAATKARARQMKLRLAAAETSPPNRWSDRKSSGDKVNDMRRRLRLAEAEV